MYYNGKYMNYDSLISDLQTLVSDNFNMDNLRKIRNLYLKMVKVYRDELAKKEKSEEFINSVYSRKLDLMNDILWDALKEKLDFEDEVINKIFCAVRGTDQIGEIYVLDGNLIITSLDQNNKSCAISSEHHYIDITDSEFIIDCGKYNMANLVVMSINNAIKPFISNKYNPDDVLSMENGIIKYLEDDLKIYVNRSMPYILSNNNGTLITKVLATYNDQLFYFDMKMRDNCVILLHNDYNVKTISTMLEEKGKTKSKK